MDYYGLMSRFNRFSLLVVFVCALTANAQTPDSQPAAPITSALDSELFYQLLLGELSARDGEPGAGYSLILDAARKTNDPRLFQRSVEIALQARSGDSALLAARAWKQALPTSKEANRYVLQILIGMNRIGETLEPLKREIATTDPKDRVAAISAIPRYFARVTDKKLAATTVEQALSGYLVPPTVGSAAWTVIGRMRFDAGDIGGAIEAASKAQAMDGKSEGPVLLALSMMSPKTPEAEAIVKKYLEGKPQPEVRMEYARALLDAQRYAEAAAQLQIITAEKPDFADAWLIRGALELQEGKPSVAEPSFKRYVELALAKRTSASRAETSRGLVQAYLSLAQIAEQRKDFAGADMWLKRIDNPEEMLNAQFRRAAILARQGKLEEARKLIRSQPEKSPADARLKVTAEVQLLRDGKYYKAAYDLLSEATSRNPTDFDLVYDMAMVADKLGNMDEMERLLRRVMAGKPDYQHAYNALGYSLAERNIRLPEAKQLILKALEYAPGDPFIIDSLGWVEFRSGDLAEALRILQGAFKTKPDAEIAAHLGEVLWSMGRRDLALSIWKEGAQLNGENETLRETLKRLREIVRREVKFVYAAIFLAIFSIAGCAVPTRASVSDQSEVSLWRGRLAVRVESEKPQSFSAGFELTGSSRVGQLNLYTPLGSTAAALSWSSQTAIMRSNGDVRYFESLDDLIKLALGTEIPVEALFAWLAGDNMAVAGWSADLSQHANGRITARRTAPAPVAELRLVLEK